MSDLISRQAAIDAVHEDLDGCRNWNASGTETANEVEMVLDCLPSAQTWISVKERLPEERKSVLLCESFGVMYVGCLVGKAEDGTAIWRDDSNGLVETYGRTFAWMPLPEPYKGESK